MANTRLTELTLKEREDNAWMILSQSLRDIARLNLAPIFRWSGNNKLAVIIEDFTGFHELHTDTSTELLSTLPIKYHV